MSLNKPDIKTKNIPNGIMRRERTYVMGVVNVTPDSFSDGGVFFDRSVAIERAMEMACEGADIIDIGGESTRPGAEDVPAAEEISRVVPVIRELAGRVKIAISVDTRKAAVAKAAIESGASIVNDVSGLRFDPDMARVIAKHGSAVILAHSKETPKTMQLNPVYDDLMADIMSNLREAVSAALSAGIERENIIIDPGIGFGKTVEHNLEILNRLDELAGLGMPVCVGVSRKSFIGKILGVDDPRKRLVGSIAAAAAAIMKGAHIVRVHDVKETIQAAQIIDSITKGA